MGFSRRVHRMGRRGVAPLDTHRLSGAVDIGINAAGALTDFTPLVVAGCKIWLRADLGVTLNGATVSAWANQADAAFLASVAQAVAANQPTFRASGINGLPDLDFDGANDLLTGASAAPLAQPNSMFVVLQPDAIQDSVVCDSSNALVRHDMILAIASTNLRLDAPTFVLASGPYAGGETFLFGAEFDNLTCKLRKNGVVRGTGIGGANALDGLVVGDGAAVSAPFNGKIAEVIVYGSVLSAGDDAAVTAYLLGRYGL